ncbi:MAG: hypothetical protein ACI9MC_002716 [Kiritimatiellia bacterium]|jgi:hypothetical protein
MTRIAYIALLAVSLTACPPPEEVDSTDETDVVAPGPLAIMGTWADSWGTLHTIDDTNWQQGTFSFEIASYDNDVGVVIVHNGADNDWNPGLWSRLDWTESPDGMWYCQTAYDAATQQEAEDTEGANASDPVSGGCGGFPWTQLTEPLDIRGDWTDNWGGDHSINEATWSMGPSGTFQVVDFDNELGMLIAHNDADNEWNPSLWSRMDYIDHEGTWYFCQITFDAQSEQAARDTATPNADDPANTGCNGFAWSSIAPR